MIPLLDSHCGQLGWLFFLFLYSLSIIVNQFFLFLQGFDDVALTPGEVAMVIYNFENWTGNTISMAELESGFLKGHLKLNEYDLK